MFDKKTAATKKNVDVMERETKQKKESFILVIDKSEHSLVQHNSYILCLIVEWCVC